MNALVPSSYREAISLWKQTRDRAILASHPWLKHLALTKQPTINYERVDQVAALSRRNLLLEYVERTLAIAETADLPEEEREILLTVLAWAEVAKGGSPATRRAWTARGYDLETHNLGSADIYAADAALRGVSDHRLGLIKSLIATHGLLGQYLRGEVPLSANLLLWEWAQTGQERESLRRILVALNHAVIGGVSPALWSRLESQVLTTLDIVLAGDFRGFSLEERLSRLRAAAIQNGEDFDALAPPLLENGNVQAALTHLLENTSLWYVEAALSDFTLEEFFKVLVLAAAHAPAGGNLTFAPLMRQLYLDRDGKKTPNLYYKRIMEKLLRDTAWEDALAGRAAENPHMGLTFTRSGLEDTTLAVAFRLSPAGGALVQFCIEAENAGMEYERAVLLLYDFFGLRRDAFDRFYNETSYLAAMNGSRQGKQVILDHVVGSRILDVGPGGGVMLDALSDRWPQKDIIGVDIAENVVEALARRRQRERRTWSVVKGDALELKETFGHESLDTVIFSSVLHELFSYIPYAGKRFNLATVRQALKSAYEVLAPGGRLIIRDGVMTEPPTTRRRIRFRTEEGMAFLRRYAADFKGRQIQFTVTGHNEVEMPVNDAMEFLYTYTWGEESYPHEVQEQFGYLTPSSYQELIEETCPGAKVLALKHYLQNGYTVALAPKVDFLDVEGAPVSLPDSTCLIVIEKGASV